MLDLKWLVERQDEARAALARRGAAEMLDEVLALDARRRDLIRRYDDGRHRQRELGAVFRDKDATPDQKARVRHTLRELGDELKALARERDEVEVALREALLMVPNVPHPSVPDGADESANIEVRRWGEPPAFDFEPLDHVELGQRLGLFDFERAARMSGARFVAYRGVGALFERALMMFMLDVHTREHGYTEILPPFLVLPEAMEGTGQLPKFADDAFATNTGHYLIPTAEVPVTNLHREEILEPGTLPLRYTAYSACFRREAGSYGRHTRGLTRLHQFQKVELVKFVEPEGSYDELEALTRDAEAILRKLGLHYRVVALCTGDLGFSAAKTYDLEVWLPGQGVFREISSCSNFEAFQARRAGIRYRPEPGAKPRFVHTLNGSGLAIGRTVMAIVENYQTADGCIVVPEVLRPYMGGLEVVEPS